MTNSTSVQDTVILEASKSPTGAWKVKFYWFAGLFTAIVFSLMIIAGWHIVIRLAPYIIGLAAFTMTLFFLFLIYEMGQNGYTHHKTHGANRRILEAEARIREAEAKKAEVFTYSKSEGVIRFRNDNSLDVLALPAPTVETTYTNLISNTSFDFYQLMTQTKKAYAIFGPQQAGKSTYAHHLVRFWQDKGISPVVIGQKFNSYEYKSGVIRFGPDKDSILEGFELVRQEAQARQSLADSGTSFDDMIPLPVFLEDATSLNTIVDSKEFEIFIRQILTVYAARLIVIYFIVHGMDITSFGLKAGAALKNALTCLYLEVPTDKPVFNAYDVRITGSIGYREKQAERIAVTGLPNGYAELIDGCESALYVGTLEVKPVMTKQERDILRLYGSLKVVSNVAEKVYGTASSTNNGKVKDVLTKYGIEIKDARKKEFTI